MLILRDANVTIEGIVEFAVKAVVDVTVEGTVEVAAKPRRGRSRHRGRRRRRRRGRTQSRGRSRRRGRRRNSYNTSTLKIIFSGLRKSFSMSTLSSDCEFTKKVTSNALKISTFNTIAHLLYMRATRWFLQICGKIIISKIVFSEKYYDSSSRNSGSISWKRNGILLSRCLESVKL